jgi:flavin reductase (DIM6/NTAB) family NADH-FMN oxidoreductase RutF
MVKVMIEYRLKEINYTDFTKEFLREDCILVSKGKDGKINLITLAWKTIGQLWSRPVITVAIRPDRFTHQVIDQGEKAFTINIGGPIIQSIISTCGTTSGRDIDKVKKTGVELIPGKEGVVPFIKGAHLVYECKILHKTDSGNITAHSLFIGEIIGSFEQIPK